MIYSWLRKITAENTKALCKQSLCFNKHHGWTQCPFLFLPVLLSTNTAYSNWRSGFISLSYLWLLFKNLPDQSFFFPISWGFTYSHSSVMARNWLQGLGGYQNLSRLKFLTWNRIVFAYNPPIYFKSSLDSL